MLYGFLARKANQIEWLLVLLIILVGGLPNLFYPFGKDQGEYAYIATAFMRGEVIYRDVFNVKPPLTHVLHAAALLLFGHDMIAIRWWDWLWQGATALVLAGIARQLYREKGVGVLAAALYIIFYFATDFWHSAQTDGFINLPIALAVWLFLYATAETRWGQRPQSIALFLSGLCVGLAVLLKYPIGVMMPFLLLMLFLKGTRRNLVISSQQSAVSSEQSPLPHSPFTIHHLPFILPSIFLLAGFVLPLLIFALWLVSRGAWPAFWQIQTGYIPQYNAGFVPEGGYWLHTRTLFAQTWQGSPHLRWFVYLWGLETALLIGQWMTWRRTPIINDQAKEGNSNPSTSSGSILSPPHPVTLSLLWLWSAAAFIHLVIQNKYYFYHFLPLLAPQALILVHFWGIVRQGIRRLNRKRVENAAAITLALVLVLFFGLAPLSPYYRDPVPRYQTAAQLLTGQLPLDDYYRRDDFGPYGWGVFSSRANLEVAAYLQQHTNPDDTIFVWAFEPEIYFLSQRWSASRYIYNFPLFPQFGWDTYREQAVTELIAEPPEMILVAQFDAQPNLTNTEKDSAMILYEFAPLHEFLQRDYRPETTIAQFTLYRYQR